MAYTVNAAFAQFIQDEVELDKMQTKTARNSRDWLLSNIENLAQNKKIPRLYGGKSINHGSFARNTKIRPLDDIDLMVCYSGTGGVYHIVEENECYTISFSNGIQVLSNLCDEQGMLNSRKVIENLKGALADISGYAKADIHRNQEAATLQLTSYPWNFDIVPCFITTSDFYLIPDGKGNWKKTDPRIDQQRITKINQTNNGQLLGLIRLMKYWKKKKWGNRISSYMFETMILDYVACHSLSGCISQDVCSLLAYLSNAIIMLLLLVIFGIQNTNLWDIVTMGIVPLLPAAKWLYDVHRQNTTNLKSLANIKSLLNSALDKAERNEPVALSDLEQIQNFIFIHRKTSFMIPSWVYKLLRKQSEMDMNYRVKHIVQDIL